MVAANCTTHLIFPTAAPVDTNHQSLYYKARSSSSVSAVNTGTCLTMTALLLLLLCAHFTGGLQLLLGIIRDPVYKASVTGA